MNVSDWNSDKNKNILYRRLTKVRLQVSNLIADAVRVRLCVSLSYGSRSGSTGDKLDEYKVSR